MSGKPFFDTNVLVYAFTSDDSRSEIAENILRTGGVVSIQVLNEFVNVSRKKHRRDWNEIEQSLRVIRRLLDPPLPLTIDVHADALEIARTYHFRFYDCLIVAAAQRAGCIVLCTEDLQHGQKIGGLKVHNPFLAT
jgi:predicted nucleic acid-binding protein